MKEKLKKIYSLIVICMIFAFCSCEKENIETTNQKNTNIVAFKNVSLKDLGTSKTNIKLIESANNIKKLKSNTQSQNKIEYNSLYDFYIDPDSGKYIETTDSKSYTFPIYRADGDENIENIVFTENPDGSYDIVTIKYDLTKEELDANPNGTEFPISHTVISSKYNVINPTDPLWYIDVLMCNNDGSGGFGEPHNAGDNCTDPGHLYVITVSGGGSSGGTGSGGGVTTTPVGGGGLGTLAQRVPCSNLARKTDPAKANIKPAISALKTILQNNSNPNGENGYALSRSGAGIFSPPQELPPSSTDKLKMPYGGDCYGGIHTHPYSGSPMFSFQDIYSLYLLASSAIANNESEVTIILVVETTPGVFDTFALVIIDPPTFYDSVANMMNNSGGATVEEMIDLIDDDLDIKYEANTNYEKTFLENFGGFGASLFKANSDLSKWNEKYLSQDLASTKVASRSCN